MKILYIHQFFTTNEGKGSTRSYDFAKYLIQQGHVVTVITGNSNLRIKDKIIGKHLIETFCVDGIKVIALRINYSNYLSYFNRAISFLLFFVLSTYVGIKEAKHDLVFASSVPLTVGLTGVIIGKLKKTPFIFEVKDLWPEAPILVGAVKNKLLIRILKQMEIFIYKNAAKIITVSPGLSEGVEAAGIESSKIEMIPNSSDVEQFKPENKGEEFIRKHGLEGKFIISYCGAFGEMNDLTDVIQAARMLKRLGEGEIVFLLVGDGMKRPVYEKMLEEEKTENVVLLKFVPKNEVVSIFAASAVCLVMLKNIPMITYRSSPNKFFDALAAGRAVLVNFDGWMRQLLEENNAGVFVKPDNPELLASTVIRLKNNRETCKQMGKNARKLAVENFNRIKLAGKLEEVLMAALKNA